MSEPTVEVVITDEDILADVHHLVRDTYGARMSREYLHIRVLDGVVILEGHLSSVVAHEMLIENVSAIDGVVGVDDDDLFHDRDLRLRISQMLPRGLRVLVSHGAVALSGRVAADVDLQEVVARIGEMRGVVLVDTDGVVQH